MDDAKLLDIEIFKNDFFHDFIVFLKYVENNNIQRTTTGNISLRDIAALQKEFRQQKIFNQFKEYGWKINSERVVEFLTQIKIISESMHITYKRKNKILISKNGKSFLHNIDSITQYWNMVLHYWRRISWEYFCPSPDIGHITVMDTIQKNQNVIWNAFLKKEYLWIDFEIFCKTIKIHFQLESFYKGIDDFSYYLDIEYGLFKKNLVRFGCVEIEEKKNKYNSNRIVRFRTTKLGIICFKMKLSLEI
ncbi:MAG: hypothetical protein UR68_C0012G0019 [Candidatus Roizmanbacteria bacterium GW2011_GWA2_35_19]|uniref:Uncharacterized protein n=2 Tax=Candidatus Roizmaniibacteriota TaxID=1752723 RepID=A0A0G0C9L3_9BACT|nr:MAG: hypothetical protein UR63_C0024G0010 [Candidatus Roizmanbacteria bacterium GW2011_GWC2_35_12]KKP72826.1 MAG: hypothetical protein UR68_C0012G0019 [Candidatus Roizmanbacteria bacterium GW2011_GWA2_35_19]